MRRFDMIRFDMISFDKIRFDKVKFDKVLSGKIWFGKICFDLKALYVSFGLKHVWFFKECDICVRISYDFWRDIINIWCLYELCVIVRILVFVAGSTFFWTWVHDESSKDMVGMGQLWLV